jgi:hypothetical protein
MTQPPINAAALVVGVDDFRALERSRLRALVDKDMPLARQLHAADFQLVTPTGSMYSRDRYLGEIESGQLTYFVWEPGPIEVRLNPTMALLRYPARIEVDSGAGRSAAFRCWHTDSYELIDGFWQLVWSQATATR